MMARDVDAARQIALDWVGKAFPKGILPGIDPAVSVGDAGDRWHVDLRMPDGTLGGNMTVIVDKSTMNIVFVQAEQ